MVAVFREVRRVLRPSGVAWVNLGDSYASGSGHTGRNDEGPITNRKGGSVRGGKRTPIIKQTNLKPKDLVGIPWRVAFALQADGWWLRSDIIWHKCLSGGTWLYVQSQKGVMPMMLKDAARLDPSTVKLWNGDRWTQVVEWNKQKRSGNEIEIVLRSGERISCTPEHRWPLSDNKVVRSDQLKVGDVLKQTRLPDEKGTPKYLTPDALWFIGLYLAEGSKSGETIQIAGHSKEIRRWERINDICLYYGAKCTRTINGNKMDIRIYGKVINAILEQHISGKTATDKCLSVVCWQYDNVSLSTILQGYLDGDGHYDTKNNRWRLGFTRNYNLERDLRVLCARLGYSITLKMSEGKHQNGTSKTFRGEIRTSHSKHHNVKNRSEIVDIRKARCRYTYDISVQDDPHLFALASGILTHNSNAMPESVRDRPTKSHEYVFLLSKSSRYFYDAEAVRVASSESSVARAKRGNSSTHKNVDGPPGQTPHTMNKPRENDPKRTVDMTRNRRTVWTIPTSGYSGAHFATFPPKLVEPMILAGTSAKGECPVCGMAWVRVIKRTGHKNKRKPAHAPNNCPTKTDSTGWAPTTRATDVWQPQCTHNTAPIPQTVLDPFAGTATVGQVAIKHRRRFVGLELNGEYIDLARERTSGVQVAMGL